MQITLKAARVNAGYRQSEIAEIIGVTNATVSNWESGVSDISAKQLNQFCEIVGVSYADILLPE